VALCVLVQFAGRCECIRPNGPSDFIKCVKFIDELPDYWLLRRFLVFGVISLFQYNVLQLRCALRY